VLIVHGANDPMGTAGEIAELIAQTDNPRVAALILPGGGHVGFAAYARSYYYSLIAGFFDPAWGAAAGAETSLAEAPAGI
jgi:predicted alpha/beta-fold hydrolase